MDSKDKPSCTLPRLMEIAEKARTLIGMSEDEMNEALNGFTKAAKRQGITVDQLIENMDRFFWAFLSEPEKERLRAIGCTGPIVKHVTFDFKKTKEHMGNG